MSEYDYDPAELVPPCYVELNEGGDPGKMIVYPLSAREERVVRWGSRAILMLAILLFALIVGPAC